MQKQVSIKRVVVKIGTSVLTKLNGTLDKKFMQNIARQISWAAQQGIKVIVVSSGAIGSGVKELNLKGIPRDIPSLQGAAAVGQSILIETWRRVFKTFGLKVAQMLLTYENFANRKTYLNLKNTIEVLAKHNTIIIINENDPISVDEIEETFGDNDKLSALVAAQTDSDLLILLTDVNGLYDKNPRHKDAKLINVVETITPFIERIGGEKGSWKTKGGMKSKIEAAKIAMKSNCDMVIANAHEQDVIKKIIHAEVIGTLFKASKNSDTHKKRWIRFSKSHGFLQVDEGAKEALLSTGSLLSPGILEIKGAFKAGDIIHITYKDEKIAKGIVEYSSKELKKIKGQRTDQIKKILGYKRHENVIRKENMVLL